MIFSGVDTVKSLATSMISAGVVAKIASVLNIDITKLSKSDLLGRLEYNLAKNSVGAVVNLGMYGKYEQGAIGGVVDALLNSVLAPMLDKVDKLTAAADFSESSREWARILVAGGVRGAITGRDTMDGILSGIAEEYVAAKCSRIVAEWEREDKIREMAEAIERDGFLDANKDQASSSSSDVQHKKKAENKVNSKQDEASSSSSAAKKSDNNTCAKATDQLLPDQEQQELLIDKIKAKLKLHRLEQAQATGVLLEIDEPIKQITKKIRNLDKVQLNALEQSFDYLTNPINFSNKGEIKLTPTALPLLPLGVEVMHLIFGATAGAYLIWKAATETAEKLQEHKKTTADSKTKHQNTSSFQAHPTEPNIFVTPPADVAPTKTVFPMDQTNPSPHVFVPADVDSKIEGYPDQSSEFNRPILLFSKKREEGNATSKLYTKNPNHGYVKVPEEFKNRTKGSLPGFEDSKYIGIKNGRSRWILPDKKIVEWDYQHGEVELYSKNGKKHLGAYDPYTGRQIKQAKPDRNVEP